MVIREEWRDVVGFEGYYQVSNVGRVFSAARIIVKCNGVEMTVSERFVRPRLNPSGYLIVTLSRDGKPFHKPVHQLVARAFIGPRPRGKEVAHWDGNQLNNFVLNLRYATPQENADDRVRHGRVPRGVAHPHAKLTDEIVRMVIADARAHAVMASLLGVSEGLVRQIRSRRIWKHVRV
ncbi:hypothetical protein NCF_04335 [Burkholderia pseudomallei]